MHLNCYKQEHLHTKQIIPYINVAQIGGASVLAVGETLPFSERETPDIKVRTEKCSGKAYCE
jgi:hypothetical protein